MYKLVDKFNVYLIADNRYIPIDVDNTEYKKYLAWLALGNTPLPADPVPIDGSIAYKAMIRRRASKLTPIESVLLLKSIGE